MRRQACAWICGSRAVQSVTRPRAPPTCMSCIAGSRGSALAMLQSAASTMCCVCASPAKRSSPSLRGAPAAAREATPSATKLRLATAESAHRITSGDRCESWWARGRAAPNSARVARKRSSEAKCATACTAAPASSGSASSRPTSWGSAPWVKSVSRARASPAMPAMAKAACDCITPPARRIRPTRCLDAEGSVSSMELMAPDRARFEKASSASWRTPADRCVSSCSRGPRQPLSTMLCTCADDEDICAMVDTAWSAVWSSGESRDSESRTTPPDSRSASVDRESLALNSDAAFMAAARTSRSDTDMSCVSAGMALASRTADWTRVMAEPPAAPRERRSWIASARPSSVPPLFAAWTTKLHSGAAAPASASAVAHRELRTSSRARASPASRVDGVRDRSRPTSCGSPPDSAAWVRASASAPARTARRVATSSCTAVLADPRDGARRKAAPDLATSLAVLASAEQRRMSPPATHSRRSAGQSPASTTSVSTATAPASAAARRCSSSSMRRAAARAACTFASAEAFELPRSLTTALTTGGSTLPRGAR
mmetsp:Transcript_1615/g.4718  ORF Transcript_1615/g.4718 Transcript_1615/m.4718 type:complete len:546 (+) Transcript_1615:807-2444(+)